MRKRFNSNAMKTLLDLKKNCRYEIIESDDQIRNEMALRTTSKPASLETIISKTVASKLGAMVSTFSDDGFLQSFNDEPSILITYPNGATRKEWHNAGNYERSAGKPVVQHTDPNGKVLVEIFHKYPERSFPRIMTLDEFWAQYGVAIPQKDTKWLKENTESKKYDERFDKIETRAAEVYEAKGKDEERLSKCENKENCPYFLRALGQLYEIRDLGSRKDVRLKDSIDVSILLDAATLDNCSLECRCRVPQYHEYVYDTMSAYCSNKTTSFYYTPYGLMSMVNYNFPLVIKLYPENHEVIELDSEKCSLSISIEKDGYPQHTGAGNSRCSDNIQPTIPECKYEAENYLKSLDYIIACEKIRPSVDKDFQHKEELLDRNGIFETRYYYRAFVPGKGDSELLHRAEEPAKINHRTSENEYWELGKFIKSA